MRVTSILLAPKAGVTIARLLPIAGSSIWLVRHDKLKPRSAWDASMRPIEASTIDGPDPTLKNRVAALKAGRNKAAEALGYARKSSATPIAIDRSSV